jgi:hypothetical protein
VLCAVQIHREPPAWLSPALVGIPIVFFVTIHVLNSVYWAYDCSPDSALYGPTAWLSVANTVVISACAVLYCLILTATVWQFRRELVAFKSAAAASIDTSHIDVAVRQLTLPMIIGDALVAVIVAVQVVGLSSKLRLTAAELRAVWHRTEVTPDPVLTFTVYGLYLLQPLWSWFASPFQLSARICCECCGCAGAGAGAVSGGGGSAGGGRTGALRGPHSQVPADLSAVAASTDGAPPPPPLPSAGTGAGARRSARGAAITPHAHAHGQPLQPSARHEAWSTASSPLHAPAAAAARAAAAPAESGVGPPSPSPV